MLVLAIFANFFVRERLVVTGDAAATATNIAESEGLFRLGIAAFLVIVLIDVLLAWGLHVLFRSSEPDLSLLTAWCRLIYSALLGVAVIFLFQVLLLLDRGLVPEALLALDTFEAAWFLGLFVFGAHLVLLGILVVRTGRAPRLLGWLLVFAGTAFAVDTLATVLVADYAEYETGVRAVVAISDVIAEGWFTLWLLFRAGRSLDRPTAAASRLGSISN